MGKYLVTCWIISLLVLMWSDVSLAKKGKGKTGGGGWGTGSNRNPQNPSYPHNPGYPQNPGYPHNPGYPQNPAYPPRNPGYPQNPGYPPRNPGYPSNTGGGWGQPHNPNMGGYNQKPWKPKKTNMKHMVGAAAAGAVVGGLGGYALGSAMSGMNFRFNNPNDERWWYENRDRYPDRVYYGQYGNQQVTSERFVHDCVNVTLTEYSNLDSADNKNMTETETKVVKQVVREMCIQQYRISSGAKILLSNSFMMPIIMLVMCSLMH
uniref:Prion protein (Kanno blood group) n=1 Tax=Sphenodon punctatus TaxID=8508 RepID=A0A8D0L0S8_SPHPU